tara:strand:- start:160 stop:1149 length:990 start_codon:yes stop_codon:yes gene_type:complete
MGLYRGGTDILRFVTAGVDRLQIAAGGSMNTPTLGTSNFRAGVGAGNAIVSGGNYNVLVGDQSGDGLTTGVGNTALGNLSLSGVCTGNHNVALGQGAMTGNTTGYQNTAVGKSALYTQSTGINNTALGWQAGYAVSTGTGNTLVGVNAGSGLSTPNQNTFVGVGSGSTVTSGANNTILGAYNGNSGGLDLRTASNRIVLSDGDGNVRFYNNGTSTSIGSPTSSKTSTGTIEIKGTSANQSVITNSDNAVSYANGAELNFSYRSGVLIINNWNNGNVELFALGAGSISRFAGTGTGAGAMSFTNGVYKWTNDTGLTHTFTHTFIQTRNDV